MADAARNTDGGAITYPWQEGPEPGRTVRVADGIEWLRLPLPMALDHVNCWILEEEGGVAIVDTGLDTEATRAMWTEALAGRPVRRVVATHHHPDHIGLAGWFRAEQGAEIIASRTAWLMARMRQFDDRERPAPENAAFWRAAGMEPAAIETRMNERPFNFAEVTAPLPLGYTRLTDEQMIEIGGRWWHVHMGDGHAPEHATLWEEGGDLVIGGDQFLAAISPNLGVSAAEPEADPVAEWLVSCERLKGYATPEKIVLPGHKLPFRGLPFRLQQSIENHQGVLNRLHAHLARPHAAGACLKPIFRRAVGADEYGLALGEALAHCLHLEHVGRARRRVEADGTWLFEAV